MASYTDLVSDKWENNLRQDDDLFSHANSLSPEKDIMSTSEKNSVTQREKLRKQHAIRRNWDKGYGGGKESASLRDEVETFVKKWRSKDSDVNEAVSPVKQSAQRGYGFMRTARTRSFATFRSAEEERVEAGKMDEAHRFYKVMVAKRAEEELGRIRWLQRKDPGISTRHGTAAPKARDEFFVGTAGSKRKYGKAARAASAGSSPGSAGSGTRPGEIVWDQEGRRVTVKSAETLLAEAEKKGGCGVGMTGFLQILLGVKTPWGFTVTSAP